MTTIASAINGSQSVMSLLCTTTTNQITLGTTNTTTINSVAPVSSKVYTIPDTGVNSNFIMSQGTQTISGPTIFTNSAGMMAGSSTYTTGTVSQSTTTITGSGTTFTASMVGGVLIYANGVQAFISGFTSTTVLTAVQSQTVNSQAFTIYYGGNQEDNSGNISVSKLNISGLTNGQLLIGSTNNIPVTSTITGTSSQIIVTNGAGSITLATPQNIATNSSPTFASETLSNTTNQLVLGTTNTTTLTATAPSSSKIYTIPDTGANANFIMSQGTQTISGPTTLTSTTGLMAGSTIYNTGTASQSTTTITGSGTTFTSGMIGGVMVYANGTVAFITGFTSTTSLTAAQSQTVSSQSYTLYYGGLQLDSSGYIGAKQIYLNGAVLSGSSLANVSYLTSGSTTYNTGTASQSTTVITGVGTTFTIAMIGGILVFNNGTPAFITGFTSTTSLTVVQSQTVSSQSYTIYYGGNQLDNSGYFGTEKQYISSTTNQIILGSGTTTTINSIAPSSSKIYTIPDTGANANFVLTQGTQTISGATLLTNSTGVMTASTTYSTGTASQSGTTITGVGTTFTTAMVGGVMIFSNGVQAFIDGYTSATVLTSIQSQTVSSTTYTLYYGGSQEDNAGNSGLQNMYTTGYISVLNDGFIKTRDTEIGRLDLSTGLIRQNFNYSSGSITSRAGLDSLFQSNSIIKVDIITTLDPGTSAVGTDFGYQIVGYLYVATTGNISFRTQSDDASDCFIDGYLIASNYGNHTFPGGTIITGTIYLQAGYHRLLYRYAQAGGSWQYQLYWDTAGGSSFAAIPSANMFFDPNEFLTYSNTNITVYQPISSFGYLSGNTTYATGTASQSTTTITGSGTTFTSSMVGGVLIYANGVQAFISGFTSTTVLTAIQSQTVSSQAFTIYYGGVQIDTSGDLSANNIYLNGVLLTPSSSTTLTNIKALTAGSTTYNTGTALQIGTAVTGILTNFTSAMTGGIIIFNGGTVAFIAAVNSATSITAYQSQTVLTVGFTLYYGGTQLDNSGYFSTKAAYLENTTNQLILGTTNTTTISSVAPSSSRVYSIQDAGANANFVMSQGTQTLAGNMTLSGTNLLSGTTTLTHASGIMSGSTTYSTGTASQSTNTITGSGTTFIATMVGGVLIYANGVQAFITEFVSTTSLIAAQSQTVSSQAFTIYYGGSQFDSAGNFGASKLCITEDLTSGSNSYSAGTASQSGNNITGVSTTWTSSMTGGVIVYNNGVVSFITGFKSTTSLISFQSQTVSSQAYAIYYNGLQVDNSGNIGTSGIGMFSNFMSINGTVYNTGTVAQSTTTVTGTGTTFTASMVGGYIIYTSGASSGTEAFIVGFGSTTSLTVIQSQTVASGTSYIIYYGAFQTDYNGNIGAPRATLSNTTNQIIFGTSPNTTLSVVSPSSSRTMSVNDPKFNASVLLGTGSGTIQFGSFNTGTNSGGTPASYTISFPHTFASTPTGIIATCFENGFTDALSAMCTAISTTSATLSIYRSDSPGAGWGVSMFIFWIAFL